jgi:pyruvate formate lyase activating enzyme
MTTVEPSEVKPLPAGRDRLPIGGIVPLTTTDYPGRLALVVFTQGCPWRCPYCHNRQLQTIRKNDAWNWPRVHRLLEARQGFLEAVVFSGGEPTLHAGLGRALRRVREMGLLTGLHTAGMFPEHLSSLLPWLDWVGLDIKAPLDNRYSRLTRDNASAAKVRQSLDCLRANYTNFQLRTTVGPGALSEADFEALKTQLHVLQAPEPVRQEVRPFAAIAE